MVTTDYSVLMSVYYKESPSNLQQSMLSVYHQTVKTNDFVLVCDGPLTTELDCVIMNMKEKFGDALHIIRLQKNNGLGKALNIGIQYCKNELVARMDSDDICRKNRCETQLTVFREHPELSIISGTVEEFSTIPEMVDARRILPEKHDAIVRFSHKRNPFNHPCVMYKKSAVEQAGGYQDFYLLEDYFLWIRMLLNGCKGYNIQAPLLWMRAGSAMYNRRSGWKYAKSQKRLFQYMRQKRFISSGEYWFSVISRTCIAIIPNFLRKLLYKYFLRKHK